MHKLHAPNKHAPACLNMGPQQITCSYELNPADSFIKILRRIFVSLYLALICADIAPSSVPAAAIGESRGALSRIGGDSSGAGIR